jgi:hypothetical protein
MMSTLMVDTQQVQENKWHACHNNKDKVVVRLYAEKHIHLTYRLLAHIYYVKI